MQKFTVKGFEKLGNLTANDVVYYDVYSCGTNIPATPSPLGLTALEETGATWNLKGMDMFIEWEFVHDARRSPTTTLANYKNNDIIKTIRQAYPDKSEQWAVNALYRCVRNIDAELTDEVVTQLLTLEFGI